MGIISAFTLKTETFVWKKLKKSFFFLNIDIYISIERWNVTKKFNAQSRHNEAQIPHFWPLGRRVK